jgi:fructose-specific phosphotransferase system IIC component
MKKLFTVNQSKKERIIRSVIGIILLAISFALTSPLCYLPLTIGGILLFNALSGVCMIYKMLGYSTCPIEK